MRTEEPEYLRLNINAPNLLGSLSITHLGPNQLQVQHVGHVVFVRVCSTVDLCSVAHIEVPSWRNTHSCSHDCREVGGADGGPTMDI